MDGRRFDELTRSFAATSARRQFLRRIVNVFGVGLVLQRMRPNGVAKATTANAQSIPDFFPCSDCIELCNAAIETAGVGQMTTCLAAVAAVPACAKIARRVESACEELAEFFCDTIEKLDAPYCPTLCEASAPGGIDIPGVHSPCKKEQICPQDRLCGSACCKEENSFCEVESDESCRCTCPTGKVCRDGSCLPQDVCCEDEDDCEGDRFHLDKGKPLTCSETEGKVARGIRVSVNDDEVPLRAAPSTNADIVDRLDEGTELEVTGWAVPPDGFLWYSVRDPNTQMIGWVREEFLSIRESE